jgi:hypothetical protein
VGGNADEGSVRIVAASLLYRVAALLLKSGVRSEQFGALVAASPRETSSFIGGKYRISRHSMLRRRTVKYTPALVHITWARSVVPLSPAWALLATWQELGRVKGYLPQLEVL